jgi:F0F1-type ATP synthase assembly protein I
MPPQEPYGRELGSGYKYISLALTFAGGVVLFLAGGLALDRWLGLTPLFTILGTLVGSGLSSYWVYLKLQYDPEVGGKRRDPPPPKG